MNKRVYDEAAQRAATKIREFFETPGPVQVAVEAARRGRPVAAQRELFPRPAWAVPSVEEVTAGLAERWLARAQRMLEEGRRGAGQGELGLRSPEVTHLIGSRVRRPFRRW